MNIVVVGATTELGRVTVRHLLAAGHSVTGLSRDSAGYSAIVGDGARSIVAAPTDQHALEQAFTAVQPDVVVNVAPQFANTLLHDGHNWKNFDTFLPTQTEALLNACEKTVIKFLVQTSFAFLYGDSGNATEDTVRIAPAADPIFIEAINAERKVLASDVPHTLLRLGYLYGPQSHDLVLYIKSFKLRRLYWSGPSGKLTNWLHFEDAAAAIGLAVEKQPKDEVYNVTDGTPVAFPTVIDDLGMRCGFKKPGHIPLWGKIFAGTIIKKQQMELLELSASINSDKIRRELGWSPRYPTYRDGLDNIISTWKADGSVSKYAKI